MYHRLENLILALLFVVGAIAAVGAWSVLP